MRYRYLLTPVLLICAVAAIGCTATEPSGGDLDLQAAISREANLSKLRSSPYYHKSTPEQRIAASGNPLASLSQ
jgi:hypothetical protein